MSLRTLIFLNLLFKFLCVARSLPTLLLFLSESCAVPNWRGSQHWLTAQMGLQNLNHYLEIIGWHLLYQYKILICPGPVRFTDISPTLVKLTGSLCFDLWVSLNVLNQLFIDDNLSVIYSYWKGRLHIIIRDLGSLVNFFVFQRQDNCVQNHLTEWW